MQGDLLNLQVNLTATGILPIFFIKELKKKVIKKHLTQ